MAAPENLKAVADAIGMSLGLVITTPELAIAQAIATALSSSCPGCCFCTDDGAAMSLHRTAIAGVATALAARAGAPLAVACAGAATAEQSAARLASGLEGLGLSVAVLTSGEAYRFDATKAARPPNPDASTNWQLSSLLWSGKAYQGRHQLLDRSGFALCAPQEAQRADICYGSLAEFARRTESAPEPGWLLLDDAGEYLDASVRRPVVCADAPGGFYLEVCPDAYLARYKSLAALLYS